MIFLSKKFVFSKIIYIFASFFSHNERYFTSFFSLSIKKNSCFIDNCVFKERGSRETIPFFFVFFNGYILFKTIESDNKKAPI